MKTLIMDIKLIKAQLKKDLCFRAFKINTTAVLKNSHREASNLTLTANNKILIRFSLVYHVQLLTSN